MKQNEVLQNLKLNSEFDSLLTSDNESLMSWLNSYAKTAGVMSEKQKSQAIANLKDKLTRQLEADKVNREQRRLFGGAHERGDGQADRGHGRVH